MGGLPDDVTLEPRDRDVVHFDERRAVFVQRHAEKHVPRSPPWLVALDETVVPAAGCGLPLVLLGVAFLLALLGSPSRPLLPRAAAVLAGVGVLLPVVTLALSGLPPLARLRERLRPYTVEGGERFLVEFDGAARECRLIGPVPAAVPAGELAGVGGPVRARVPFERVRVAFTVDEGERLPWSDLYDGGPAQSWDGAPGNREQTWVGLAVASALGELGGTFDPGNVGDGTIPARRRAILRLLGREDGRKERDRA